MPTAALFTGSLAGTLLVAVAGLPLAAALAVLLAGLVSGHLRRTVNVVAASSLLALALLVGIAAFIAPISVTLHTLRLPTATLPLTIALDPLGSLVLMALVLAEWTVGVFSVGYVPEGRNTNGYFVLLWLSIAALNGTLLAGDLVMLFASAAFASVALMLLVALDFTDEGAATGLKVFVMTGLAAATGFTVAWLALAEVPSLQLTNLAANASRFARPDWQPLLVVLLVALAVRAGLAPLHTWVTDPAVATLPTVGIVVGVIGVVSGAAILVRLGALVFAHDRGWLDLIATLGAATIVLGGLGALRATDALHGLTFLSIAQAGLAVNALGTSAFGIELAVFQLLHAGVALSLLYLAVARAKKPNGALSYLDLWRSEPVVGVALLIGGASVAAWPATSGYLPRALLVANLLQEGGALPAIWLVAVLFGTALTSWAALRLLWPGGAASAAEPVTAGSGGLKLKRASRLSPRSIELPLAGLAGGCMLLGIAGPAVWEQVILSSGGVQGIVSTQSPTADLFSMLLVHTALILVFAVATALRATELGQAPVVLQDGAVRVTKRLGLVARIGGRGLRLAESRWLDLYNVVWTALLVLAQASAFLLDQTVGRLGRPS